MSYVLQWTSQILWSFFFNSKLNKWCDHSWVAKWGWVKERSSHYTISQQQRNKKDITCLSYFSAHYRNVIMSAIASEITSVSIVRSTVHWLLVLSQIKENIKALRHCPLCREFTGHRWIFRTKGQLRGKCFHLRTSSCVGSVLLISISYLI